MDHNNDYAITFTSGVVISLFSLIKSFFLQAHWPSPSEFFIRGILTIVVAFAGGLASMLAKDAYTTWLQPKIKKLFSKNKKRSPWQK